MNIIDKDILFSIAKQIDDRETFYNFTLCNKKTNIVSKRVGHEKFLKTICLVMIVNNEDETILPCLESVYKHIDTYIIYDIGIERPTDNIIIKFFNLKGIKGNFIYSSPENIPDVIFIKCDYVLKMFPSLRLKSSINLKKVVKNKDIYNALIYGKVIRICLLYKGNKNVELEILYYPGYSDPYNQNAHKLNSIKFGLHPNSDYKYK